MTAKLKSCSLSEGILYLSLILTGCFHGYLSCLLSLLIMGAILFLRRKNGTLILPKDRVLGALSFLALAYLFVSLWAVDSSVALLGFFKFLPLPLFRLLLAQENHAREGILLRFPYFASGMTLVSVLFSFIPVLRELFTVAGRLGGFLQYPNSFAMVLLVALLLLLTKKERALWDFVCLAILLVGILLTGSRTVFVLTLVSATAAVLMGKNKKLVVYTLLSLAAGAMALVLVCLVSGNFDVLARYLSISTSQSTFVGRLLYVRDALPVILKNPLGLGYMGYYFMEQSIQTGLYSVMYVHNDLIQILLDVGWVPFLVFVFAVGKSLASRSLKASEKLILVTMLLHALFDFDLQYMGVFLLFSLFLAPVEEKKLPLRKKTPLVPGLCAALGAACLFFGVVQALNRFGLYSLAETIYPNTLSETELILKAESTSEAEALADRILKRNEFVLLSYSAKARAAYQKGDFASVIHYKTRCISVAPFAHAEYVEYGEMLCTGIQLYENAGDSASAERCRKELVALSRALPAQEEKMSELGKKIKDQPSFDFPSELQTKIRILGGRG